MARAQGSREHPASYYEKKSTGSKYAKSARDYESGQQPRDISTERDPGKTLSSGDNYQKYLAFVEVKGHSAPYNPSVTYPNYLGRGLTQAEQEQPQENAPIDLRTTKPAGEGAIDLRTERENPLDTLLDLKIASSPLLQALTSPITTAALAATLAVAGAGIVLAPVALKALTPSALAVATKATYGTAAAYNAKNIVLSAGVMTKMGVSAKAITLFGGWAGAVFLGKWGQAEAGEPLSIIMRDVLKQAEETGDWTLYDEAKAARDEITDLSLWEKIALWSPLAPLVGITNKIRGVLAGANVIDKLARDKQLKQLTGESDDDKWDRIRQEQVDSDKGMVDYYNDERKKMVEWEQEARTDQRNDDADFWRKERAKQDAKEKISQEDNAQFWTDYRKETIVLEEEAAQKSADFWLDYQKEKQQIQTGATGQPGPQGPPGEPGAPAPAGTSRTYMPGSQLGFGLLKTGGGYLTEEEEEKKKK